MYHDQEDRSQKSGVSWENLQLGRGPAPASKGFIQLIRQFGLLVSLRPKRGQAHFLT